MSIEYKKGDILQANAEALVNTVNTVGVMGKGIALAFKKAFPENYKLYKKACQTNQLQTGQLLITETRMLIPKYIINFPTKKHWRHPSKIEYIKSGLKELKKAIKKLQIKSIAIPPLGCGNGKLNWQEVKPLIVKELEALTEVRVLIYEPGFTPSKPVSDTTKNVPLTPTRAMFLLALKEYLILGYSINLLVAQKIAYFLERLGEPMKLRIQKGHYGPYSHPLQHLLKHLNYHYLKFNENATRPDTDIELLQTEKVKTYCEKHLSQDQKKRLQTLLQLIEGFESPYGLELLATIDFICKQEKIQKVEDIKQQIGNWTKRKKEIMKPHHIEIAYNRLQEYYQKAVL